MKTCALFFYLLSACFISGFNSECFAQGGSLVVRRGGSGPWANLITGNQTVSVTRLRHRPGKRAAAAFRRAAQYLEKEQTIRAAEELEQAVASDPEFSEAQSNLGAVYADLNRIEDAERQFQRAVQLDEDTSVYHSNWAYTLLRLGRYSQGRQEARAALQLDATNTTAHFILGWELSHHPEQRDEAVGHLQSAAARFPEAHYILATLWRFKGNRESAAREMNAYTKARHLMQVGVGGGP